MEDGMEVKTKFNFRKKRVPSFTYKVICAEYEGRMHLKCLRLRTGLLGIVNRVHLADFRDRLFQ
jgi:hypothetical protein